MERQISSLIIEKYDGFIFDLDGTIYLDDKIILHADLVINKLKELGKKLVFISNKTTGSIEEYYHFLRSNEISVLKDEIITSTLSIKKYLSAEFKSHNFYAIGESQFINEITNCGLTYCENPNKVDIVIITLDRTLNYTKLEIAAKSLDNGARFFAANIDDTCPVEKGEILDAGATISALEKRTHRKLEQNFGKPSRYILDEAFKKLKIPRNKCLIIGDRVETDIAMGNIFDIDTALVSTGVGNNGNSSTIYKPTYKLNSVADLLQ